MVPSHRSCPDSKARLILRVWSCTCDPSEALRSLTETFLKEKTMAKDVKETKPAVRGRTEIEPWRFSNVERMFEDWFEDFWGRPFPRMWRPGFGRLRALSLEAPA